MLIFKDKSIRTILSACPVGILLSDEQGNIVFCNTMAEKIFDYNQQALCQLSIEQLLPRRFRGRHTALRQGFNLNPAPRPMGEKTRLLGLTSRKVEVPMEIGLSTIELEAQEFTLITIIDRSESDRIAQLESVNHQLELAATHDFLTGLANRRLFVELVEKLMGLAVRTQQTLAFAFIDLDGFKLVNDTYGHDIGDHLLIAVAQAMQRNVRKSDVIGRIGGDEFLVCLNYVNNQEDVRKIAEHLLSSIAGIKQVKGCPIEISASIGLVNVKMTESVELMEIIKQADKTMYQAKTSGKGKVVYANYLA